MVGIRENRMADDYYGIRAVVGFLAIMTLLGMLIVDFWANGLIIRSETILILAGLIAASVGIDVIASERERILKAIAAAIDAYYEDNNE